MSFSSILFCGFVITVTGIMQMNKTFVKLFYWSVKQLFFSIVGIKQIGDDFIDLTF